MKNRFAWLSLVVLVIAVALIGCGGGGGGGDTANPVGPVVSTGPVANLTGVVSFAGQPLADAEVHLYRSEKALQAGVAGLSALRGSAVAQTMLADGNYFTKSDATGRYSFSDIPVGEYTLIAGTDEMHQYAQTGILLGSVQTADAQLTPTGKAFGKIQLSTGQAVSGAFVHLEKTSYVAITDASGDFVLNHVPAGQTFSLGVVSTLGSLASPVSLTVAPAENKSLGTIALAVTTQQLANITGNITAADTSVPTSALAGRIVILTSAEPYMTAAMSDSTGKFTLAVKAAGNYSVSVVSGEYSLSPATQNVNVAALGTTVSLGQPFVLAKPAVTTPTAVNFAFSGVINKRSKAFNEADEAGVPLTLTAIAGSKTVYSAVTSPTGAFSFSVPAGSYNLAAGGGYAFETTYANPVVISANTALTAAIMVVPTQVFSVSYLVEGSLNKETRLNNETDNANVIVTLTPTTGAAISFAGATTGTGNFAIRVPAGTYNLAIAGDYRFKTPFANPVTVSGNFNVGTGLLLVPAVTPVQNFVVSGTALKIGFASGETHAGTTIALTPTTGMAQTFSGITDAAGAFSITVPAGTYNLSVISSSYKPETGMPATVNVTANQTLAAFNLSPLTTPAPLYTVGGTVLKNLFIDGESDHGGVTVTLSPTSGAGNTYSAVSTGVGSFSMQVPAGSYNISLISSRYKPASALPNPVTVSANRILADIAIAPIHAPPVALFNLGGTFIKNIFVGGESDHGGVTIAMTPVSGAGNTYSSVTTSVGSFSIRLPAGSYNLSVISSLYKPAVAIANPVVVSSDQALPSRNLAPINPPVALFTVSGNALKSPFVNGETTHDGLTVSLISTTGAAQTYSDATDSSGNYSIQVPPGTYNMTLHSSLYKTTAALAPVTVTSANLSVATFNVAPINPPVLQYVVEGWLNKTALIAGDSGNGGVVVTLTSTSATPKTYDTVTDAGGYFKMTVAPDTYNLGVSSGYKFAAAVSPYNATAGNVTISPALSIVPLAAQLFNLSGSVSKSMFKLGDSSNADVNITLRPEAAGMQTQFAVTDSYGNFNFKVPNGNYKIEIGSGYAYVTDPTLTYPHTVAGVDLTVSAIAITPDATQLGSIRGLISSPINKPYTIWLYNVTSSAFVDAETTAAGSGNFGFYNVPAGTYRVVVMPTGNGHYGESTDLILADGEAMLGVNLTTSPVAPVISSAIVTETLLDLSGNNFLSLPVDPTKTEMYVDNALRGRASGYTSYSNTTDQCTIISVAPGSHSVVLEKSWTRPGTSEVYELHSEPFDFLKPIGTPQNLAVKQLGSTYATLTWENQKFTQDSIIDVYQASTLIVSHAVTGSSFQITGLLPQTTYTTYVYNSFGDIKSSPPAAQIFTTRAAAPDAGITSRTLAGSTPGYVFGFEVLNGVTYIAKYDINTGGGIFITAYNPDGTASPTAFTFNNPTITSGDSFSFCSGNNNLYLVFTDNRDSLTYVNSFSAANLSVPVASSEVDAGAAVYYSENDLVYANNKLFNVGARYNGSVHITNLHVFTTPSTDLTAAQLVSTDSKYNSEAGPTAKICKDLQFLYCAKQADDSGRNLVVEKYPLLLTGPTTPEVITIIPGPGAGAASNYEFACGNGRLYLRCNWAEIPYEFIIDPETGFYSRKNGGERFNYAADNFGRLWMADMTVSSFVQIGTGDIYEKSLPVFDFPVSALDPTHAELIKLDSITGSFNMLGMNSDLTLRVLSYPANY